MRQHFTKIRREVHYLPASLNEPCIGDREVKLKVHYTTRTIFTQFMPSRIINRTLVHFWNEESNRTIKNILSHTSIFENRIFL